MNSSSLDYISELYNDLSLTDLSKLSERSLDILSKEKRIIPADGPLFLVEIDQNKRAQKIIFKDDPSFKKTLVGRSLEKIMFNKNFKEISSVSFRELESFLRDRNDQEALGDHKIEINELFQTIRADLLVAFALAFPEIAGLKKEVAWPRVDCLVNLNKDYKRFFEGLNIELVLANNEEIYFKSSYLDLSSKEIETIVSSILLGLGREVPMKLVAV